MRVLRGSGTLDILSLEVFSLLQLWTFNEPLLPNLKTLELWRIEGPFVPFIPLFLSLRVISILLDFKPDLPSPMVASTVSSLPKLCPELQAICLSYPPRDPIVTNAVSGMVLATNRNILQQFYVNFPLTEEASEVIFKLSSLRGLSVVIEGETSLPSASLPNLTDLLITCDNEGDWPQLFHGATFGKLEDVTFCPKSEETGDLLGAFEKAAVSSSIQDTLSVLNVFTSSSWNPNYSSLLPFTQLVELEVDFSCENGCSSRVDDDVIINLSRAMPKLQSLKLGGEPCEEFTTGATAKGLVALAFHCPDLQGLCIHFQVASLSVPPASHGIDHNTGGSWTGRGLTLKVGDIVLPEESVLVVALTLLRIFPRIENIGSLNEGWEQVKDAIQVSKKIVDCSSKQ